MPSGTVERCFLGGEKLTPPTAARGATEPQRTSNFISWMSPTWPCSPCPLLLPWGATAPENEQASRSAAQRPACSGRELHNHSTARTFPTGRRPSQADGATCRATSGALENSSKSCVLIGKATIDSRTDHQQTIGLQRKESMSGEQFLVSVQG